MLIMISMHLASESHQMLPEASHTVSHSALLQFLKVGVRGKKPEITLGGTARVWTELLKLQNPVLTVIT